MVLRQISSILIKKFLISTLLIIHSMIFENQGVNPTLPKATYQIPNYDMIDYSNAIRVIFSFPESKSNNISKRIQNTYRAFMGKSYYLPESPLGEGKQSKFDKNPLFRTDTFDCVTLVDTVLALIESNNIRKFKCNIIKIRYRDAHIGYIYRDHWFSQVDWNKVNQENNLCPKHNV